MSKSADSYGFSPEELLKLMIKDADVREGRWALRVNFDMKAGNFSVNEERSTPGAAMLVSGFQIARVGENEEGPLIMDAQEVKPSE